jgi:uncharacterized protein YaaW (UPF0174 family)
MAINQAVCATFKQQLLDGDHDISSDTIKLEQYMLLEFLSGQVEKQQATLDENADTKIMIKHLEEMVDQLEKDVEKLKDATREIKFANGNGNGGY